MKNIITIKKLRKNMQDYINRVQESKSFLFLKRLAPVFKIGPAEETWEELIDFTKIKKGGIEINELLKRF